MQQDPDISKVKTFRHEMPEMPPLPPDRKRPVRAIIGILTAFLVVLLVVTFLQSPTARILSGKGAVQGQVVNDKGEPLLASVIIFGTEIQTKTGADGNFILENIPAGQQMLVAVYNISAAEYPILVVSGDRLNVGQIKIASTPTP